MTAAAKKRSTPSDLVGALTGEVDGIRRQIENLRERREIVEAAPRPLEDALADCAKVVQSLAERVEAPTGYLSSSGVTYHDAVSNLQRLQGREHNATPVDLLAAVAPDLMTKWLQAEVRKSYKSLPATISPPDKVRQLKEIDRQILSLERQEADLLWGLEDAGLRAPWRSDLSAIAVLGVDES